MHEPPQAAKRSALMQPRIAGPSWPKTTSKTRRAGGSSVAARGLAVAGTLRSPPLLGPSERTSRPAIFHFARGAACARPTLLVPRTRLRARSADAQAGQGPPARRKGEWPRQRARDAGASPGTPLQAWPPAIRGLGPSPRAVCRRCRAVTPPPLHNPRPLPPLRVPRACRAIPCAPMPCPVQTRQVRAGGNHPPRCLLAVSSTVWPCGPRTLCIPWLPHHHPPGLHILPACRNVPHRFGVV